MRLRELSGRVSDWPRYAQAAGMILGVEQMAAWWITGMSPNYGAMTFAAALLMITRVAPVQERRNEKRGRS